MSILAGLVDNLQVHTYLSSLRIPRVVCAFIVVFSRLTFAAAVFKDGDSVDDSGTTEYRRELVISDAHLSRHPRAALQHRLGVHGQNQFNEPAPVKRRPRGAVSNRVHKRSPSRRPPSPARASASSSSAAAAAAAAVEELEALPMLPTTSLLASLLSSLTRQSERIQIDAKGKGSVRERQSSLPPPARARSSVPLLSLEAKLESLSTTPDFEESFGNNTTPLPLSRTPKPVHASDSVSRKFISYSTATTGSVVVNTANLNTSALEVAVCFVGQFVRPGADKVRRHVRSVMAGAPQSAQFDAFFSMSTQRSELNPTDELNGKDLCQNMLDNGFRYCEAQQWIYNGSNYIAETKQLGFLMDTVYPHRTASLLHTISRCADRIRRTASYRPLYRYAMFTRLDIYQIMTFHNFRGAFPVHSNGRVIGTKRESAVDDRVLIGPVEYMVHLSGIYEYFISYQSDAMRVYPEAVLYDFFQSYPSRFNLPCPSLPKTECFVKLSKFERNWNKVDRGFSQELAMDVGFSTSQAVSLSSTLPASTAEAQKRQIKKKRAKKGPPRKPVC